MVNLLVEHMFLRQYTHSLDSKGRMTIPARFRDLLTDGVYITRGYDQNLRLLTDSAFTSMAERINQLSDTNPKARRLKRHFFSGADRLEIDRLGRVLIPQFLREFAGLENEAVIVGRGNEIEVWAPESWKDQEEGLNNFQLNAQDFADLDLSSA